MTIKQFNKKIQIINDLIGDLEDHKSSVIQTLEDKREAIDWKVGERDGEEYTAKEQEIIDDIENTFLDF